MSEISLRDIMSDHYIFHSRYQHDYLITAKGGGTIYGQYKQCLRELYARVGALRDTSYNRDLTEIGIREIEFNLKIDKYPDSFSRERDEVELQYQYLVLESQARAYKETAREAQRFWEQAQHLKPLVGELNDKTRNKYEEEMWEYRLYYMAYLDYMIQGRLTTHALEHMLAAPPQIRKRAEKRVKSFEGQGGVKLYIESRSQKLAKVISETPILKDPFPMIAEPFMEILPDGQK